MLKFSEFLDVTNSQSIDELDSDRLNLNFDVILKPIVKALIGIKIGETKIAQSFLDQIKSNEDLDKLNEYAFTTVYAYTYWQSSENFKMYSIVRPNLDVDQNKFVGLKNWFDYFKAVNLHLMGLYFWDQGNLKQALRHFNDSVSVRKEISDLSGIADSLANIGQIYQDSGEMDKSHQILTESIITYQNANSKAGEMYVKIMLCEHERRVDNLQRALDYALECLAYFENHPTSIHYGQSFHEKGATLRRMGKLESARENIENAIRIKKSAKNYFELFYSYLEYSYLLTEIGDIERIDNLLEEIRDIKIVDNILYLSILRRLTEAIIYKSKPKLLSKAKAQEKLIEVVNDPDIENHHMLKFLGLVNLLELYIFELGIHPNQELVNEIQKYLKVLNEIGENTSITSLSIQCEIISANFELVLGNFEIAMELLGRNLRKCDEMELVTLKHKIQSDIKQIENLIKSWENFLSSEYSEKFQIIKIQNYLKEIAQDMPSHKY